MTETVSHVPVSRFSPGRIFRSLFADVFHLPRWQQLVLSLGIIAGVAGWVGTFGQASSTVPQSPVAAPVDGAAPRVERPATPWVSRAGVSLVVGFVVGWLFRTFTRIMALLAVVFAAVLGGLSYLHVVNADMTAAATQEYHTASAWLGDQAGRLKQATMAHVPSTSTAAFGAFLGAWKKRRPNSV